MDTDGPNAAGVATMAFWSAASSRRLAQATCRRRTGERGKFSEPLNAALPGQATKAMTGRRTSNELRFAKFEEPGRPADRIGHSVFAVYHNGLNCHRPERIGRIAERIG